MDTPEGNLRVTVDAKELLGVLTQIGKLAAKNASIPVLSHARLRVTTADSYLYLDATDLEVSTTWAVPLDGLAETGSFCLGVHALKTALKGAAAMKVPAHLAVDTDKGTCELSSAAGTTTLRGLPAADFPVLPTVEETPTSLEAVPFFQAIHATLPAVSREESRFQLSGALADFGARQLIATDGHRLHAVLLGLKEAIHEENNHIVPRHALYLIDKMPKAHRPKRLAWAFSIDHGSLTGDRWRYTYRIVDGTYPDYERVIREPDDEETLCRVESAALAAAISAVEPAVSDNRRAVRTEMNGKITLSASNPEVGSAEAICSVLSSNGRETTLGLNPDYLLDLARVGGDVLEIHAWDENSQLVAHGADGFRAVVMPVRL